MIDRVHRVGVVGESAVVALLREQMFRNRACRVELATDSLEMVSTFKGQSCLIFFDYGNPGDFLIASRILVTSHPSGNRMEVKRAGKSQS